MADTDPTTTPTTTATTTTAPTDGFLRPKQILSHAEGVVLRVPVSATETVDVLVGATQRKELLTTLSHALTGPEVREFTSLLGRQGR